eukprot:g1006.t1
MDAVGRALFSGHALTAAQTFVAGVSRPKKKRLGGMEVRGEERCEDVPQGLVNDRYTTLSLLSVVHACADLTALVPRDSDGEIAPFSFEPPRNGSDAPEEGTFKVRMRNGVGHLLEANSGASYSGQFLHERRHRHGVQKYSDSSYDGFWSHGEKHGQGLFQSSTGTYDGKWEESLKHGAGKQLYKNGDEYHGTWYQGQCSGKGVYYHANGAEFHGAWAAGKRHGGGMYFGPKGQKEHHIYQFGVLMERRILLPGSKPPRGHRVIQPMHTDQTLKTQAHIDMLKDTMFDSIPYMGHLSVKDSTLLDLSAPSIRRQQAAANVAEMKRASALLGRGPAVSCTALA